MPKAILEFNLDDPDDREAFELATNAAQMSYFIHSFSQDILRAMDKYGVDPKFNNDASALISHVREEFYRLKNEYNVICDT